MEKPSIPKGTRDFGPAQMATRQFILDAIRAVFKKFGFQPLETPAMENLATLSGKYGEEGDQLIFKILNSGDFLKDASADALESRDSRALSPAVSEKGLRYDLTVPFARYVVMNRHEIAFPFRRYQIQPVWRADRPQKGRYREFYQCDADVIGTHSLLCEAEIILMIREIFVGLGITGYTIKVNHRAILSALAALTASKEKETALFVAIDKLDKIGEPKVREELKEKGFTVHQLDFLFEVLGFHGPIREKIEKLKHTLASVDGGLKGLADLEAILEFLRACGADESHLEFDVALARGLSYYTGCIFEVKVSGVAVGSVSGGGRYDNLTGFFGLPDISGVGISFGVDRLHDAMEELKLFPAEAHSTSKILIAHADEESFRFGLSVLKSIREQGIAAEIYPDPAKFKKQFDYANRKSIPLVVAIGSEETNTDLLTLKFMNTGVQVRSSVSDIIRHALTPQR